MWCKISGPYQSASQVVFLPFAAGIEANGQQTPTLSFDSTLRDDG
jgi:hypothetical protein